MREGLAGWSLLGVVLCGGCQRTAAAPDASSVDAAATPVAAAATAATAAKGPEVDAASFVDAGSRAPFVSRCKDVAFTIALTRGEEGISLDAKLVNHGHEPVDLVRTGDGSTGGRRNPSVTFDLRPDTPAPAGACGLMNAFEDADFVTLRPGDAQKLAWLNPPTPAKPGRYTLRATYRNDPSHIAAGVRLTDAQRARHERTLPCEVTSNPITFEWTGTKATSR